MARQTDRWTPAGTVTGRGGQVGGVCLLVDGLLVTCAHCLIPEVEGEPEPGESFQVSIRGSAPFDAQVAPNGWRPGECDLAVLRPVGDLPDDVTKHRTKDNLNAPKPNGSYVVAPWDDGLGREADIAARPESDARSSTGGIVTFRLDNAIDQIHEGYSGGPVFSTGGRSRRLVGLVKGVVDDRPGQFEVIDGGAIASSVDRVRKAAAPAEGSQASSGVAAASGSNKSSPQGSNGWSRGRAVAVALASAAIAAGAWFLTEQLSDHQAADRFAPEGRLQVSLHLDSDAKPGHALPSGYPLAHDAIITLRFDFETTSADEHQFTIYSKASDVSAWKAVHQFNGFSGALQRWTTPLNELVDPNLASFSVRVRRCKSTCDLSPIDEIKTMTGAVHQQTLTQGYLLDDSPWSEFPVNVRTP